MPASFSNNFLTLMDEFFEDGVRPVTYSIGKSLNFSPSVNITEFKDRYEVELSAPGIKIDNLEVQVSDEILHIDYQDSQSSQTENKKDGQIVRREFNHYLKFSRKISLPKDVNQEAINADYKQGIVKITIEKTPKAKPKTVKVSVSEA